MIAAVVIAIFGDFSDFFAVFVVNFGGNIGAGGEIEFDFGFLVGGRIENGIFDGEIVDL